MGFMRRLFGGDSEKKPSSAGGAGTGPNAVPGAGGPQELATSMDKMAELAGFFAAHAVWCVSDAETLIPMVAFEKPDGSRQMLRLVTEKLEEAVANGKEWLARNPESALRAVLVYDGFVTLPGGKTDALVVEAAEYGPSRLGFSLVVPYRNAKDPAGFAVDRPKFLHFEGLEPSYEAVGEALFRGVDRHEKGAAVWNKSLDEGR